MLLLPSGTATPALAGKLCRGYNASTCPFTRLAASSPSVGLCPTITCASALCVATT
jgi:hypothetical protein